MATYPKAGIGLCLSNERAFFLGLLLGIAGSLIPDLPSAYDTLQSGDVRSKQLTAGVYILFGLLVIMLAAEVM